MPWEFNHDRPIYLQLIETIQQNIVNGTYNSGDKLPSVRELATEAAVNPNTMQKALSELEKCGLIYTNRTTGRFITDDTHLIEEMKFNAAKELMHEYLHNMKNLGFSYKDSAALLQHLVSDDTDEAEY